MWLGELITQRGIGNGMSILIFTSVVSRLPFSLDPRTPIEISSADRLDDTHVWNYAELVSEVTSAATSLKDDIVTGRRSSTPAQSTR